MSEGKVKLTEAQQSARLSILRDVQRSGGQDRWSHLHSHGHHYMQVQACVRRGDLLEDRYCEFELTPSGRAALSEHGEAALQEGESRNG